VTVALILSPFVIAPLAIWLVARRPSSARWLALWPAFLTVVFARELAALSGAAPRLVEAPWAASLGLRLSFLLDGLGLLFALLIVGIGTLVVFYASSYLHDHPHAGRFHGALFAFMGSMVGVALGDNLLTLFVFWELTGFTSFILIGFEHEKADARAAALQALLVTGAGGLALLAAGLLIGQASGTFSLATLLAAETDWTSHPHYEAIALLVLVAAFTKSAQFPFHFWLPNAMAAPTPVSAYLHSATMVKAGVYLVARMAPLLGGSALWTGTVVAVGAATMVMGAWRAAQETDLKRVLAYSTVSALGVMTMLLGLGTRAAAVAALVYLVAHACYKGGLFLVAGAIDHETGSREITNLGGLARAMPFTATASLLAAASMAGLPLLVGFIAKEALYDAVFQGSTWPGFLLALTVAASALLGLVALVAGVLPFVGRPGANVVAHEAPVALWLPPLVLAVAGTFAGLLPAWLDAPLGAAALSILREPADVHFALWHGATPVFFLSLLTLVLVGVAYAGRAMFRRLATARVPGPERLYVGAFDALDALSRAIGPSLHAASLRSYVLATAVTAAAFIGVALASADDVRTFTIATGVRWHEVLIVGVIVAAAVSAARATSSMAAVLALGTVGYGVALLFVSFSAPDLAMTQFSVETLTVVIFVLVFRHFPRFGVHSPTWVRLRDGLVAGTIGVLMAALVIFVGTSGTPSRLAGYFVENSVPLAHGRNIVNVILVDFRALDTLGEITVLVTAAIGVLAALRIASGRHNGAVQAAGSPPPTSSILRTGTRTLMPLLLLFALFLLLRGHHEPGGGFVGGLVVAAAFSLYMVAYGVPAARRALIASPGRLLGVGLAVALASGLPALVRGQPFLTGWWSKGTLPIGTPLIFDIGVFLVVIGVVLTMTFSLAEED